MRLDDEKSSFIIDVLQLQLLLKSSAVYFYSESHLSKNLPKISNQKSHKFRIFLTNSYSKIPKEALLTLVLWLSTKRNKRDSNYAAFRLPWVHSLHCPSKNFFFFFAFHLRISSFFRSPSKNFFLLSMRVF